MVEPKTDLTYKLLDLIQKTGYPIVQHNGQRKFGPPTNWSGSPPPKGCEVFVGKLPREIYEDELVPIFSQVGTIYEMRLMMDFSGSNRGYAFVTFSTRSEAAAAVKKLNGLEIRPGRRIGVVKSVDNCRLFVGGIPKTKTKEQVLEELTKHVAGIVDVIVYKNCFDRRLNRGFAFVEFTSHRAAAMARRALVPGCTKLWDLDVMVDWAEPEPDVDEEQMKKVKVLYVRNFQIRTPPEVIQTIFENAIDNKIERIKKIYDYAFIHFHERSHAELALTKLQNTIIDGVEIEIKWSKPVDRELYRIQKMNKGNAKFNLGLDFSQTLLLYKQHVAKREYANSGKEDEGIGSGCTGNSPCGSPEAAKHLDLQYWNMKYDHTLAPARLDSICKRYMWAPPSYEYLDVGRGAEMWVCRVELPHVGQPLLTSPRRIGPLVSRPAQTRQEALTEAAETALHCIKILRTDLIQASTSPMQYNTRAAPFTGTPLPAPGPMFSTMLPAQPPPMSIGVPFDYMSVNAPALYSHPAQAPMPLAMPPIWRTV